LLDVPPIEVQADAEQLGQILANVLTNALKYSLPDTPVRVRARSSPSLNVAWVEVRDWGYGVPAEDAHHLFQKFFRARNVRESALPGTGLGLYMAKRLVEAQGGTIRLRSRLDHGTSVRVSLSLA
jgi:signal transduction histidine kinase